MSAEQIALYLFLQCVSDALAIVTYASHGGFMAVCWPDAIQGVLMIGALLRFPVAVSKSIAVESMPPRLATFTPHNSPFLATRHRTGRAPSPRQSQGTSEGFTLAAPTGYSEHLPTARHHGNLPKGH